MKKSRVNKIAAFWDAQAMSAEPKFDVADEIAWFLDNGLNVEEGGAA